MPQPSLFNLTPDVMTVSEINAYIRHKFEADITLQDVWLEGEISNWKRAASGHIYFTLKDTKASLRGVIWRSQAQRLSYLPHQDGEAVLAHGRISVYEASGNYQFYVDDLQPIGQGALHIQFEQLKQRLAEEGLFDEAFKQPLPLRPQQIGIVTSPDAAALRDILNVLRRRYPIAQVVLAPTLVQGETAPPQIRAALQTLIDQAVDVIIVTRGGGSLEDLWAFNDEALARQIVDCPIPVVSGVGHEIDFTIADFVADVRAPTPSAAAELVTPDQAEIARLIYGYQLALIDRTEQTVSLARARVQHQQWALERLSPERQINDRRQQIDNLLDRAQRTVGHQLSLQREKVNTLTARLTALDPQATLSRGYAIVQKGDRVVTEIDDVSTGDEITVKVNDGTFRATVK